MKEDGSKRMKKGKGKGKGKAITCIALAAIMLASVMVAMMPAVNAGELYPGTGRPFGGTANASAVIGERALKIVDTSGAPVTSGSIQGITGTASEGVAPIPLDGTPVDTVGKGLVSGSYRVYDAAGTLKANVTFVNPTMTVQTKIGDDVVTSVAKGGEINLSATTNLYLITHTSGTAGNITSTFDYKLTDPNNVVIKPATLENISVDLAGKNTTTLNTTGFTVGTYTLYIKTNKSTCNGLEASSGSITFSVTEPGVTITADKTTQGKFGEITFTGTATPMSIVNLTISSGTATNVWWIGGKGDVVNTQNAATTLYITVPKEGTYTAVANFTETGSYTIKATVDTHTATVSVSIIAVTATVTTEKTSYAVGEEVKITGTVTRGNYALIFIAGDWVKNATVKADKTFEYKWDTREKATGSYKIEVWVADAIPATKPTTAADATTSILLTSPGLTAEIDRAVAAVGDDIVISGTAIGATEVEVLAISPKGEGGTGISGSKGLDAAANYWKVGVSSVDYTFSKKITVSKDADTGSHLIVVLARGGDAIYGRNISATDIWLAVAPYNLQGKTPAQLLAILQDVTINAVGSDDLMWIGYINVTVNFFDTESPKNPYPSISGTHNGTITPSHNISVSRLFTYSCSGTGGHTEYVKIWNSTGWNAIATWNDYQGDWHNITFDESFTLYAGTTYNYTIRTGSYPQIHHKHALLTSNGWINCTEFVDANGKRYTDWIPAIKLH